MSALKTLLTRAGRESDTIIIYPLAQWRLWCNFVSRGCNFVILGQIIEKSNEPMNGLISSIFSIYSRTV